MTTNKLRVGVIGCGAIAQRRHLPEYLARHDVEIVAVCDFSEERANQVKEQFGAQYAITSTEQLLAFDEIDAVSVCTPNQFHAAVSIQAMKAGKHVLCEKPMATTIEEAREMVKAAEENGVYLMVGHNQRLMPVHQKAKEMLKLGKLGKVLTFATTFGHSGPENWSVDGAKSWFFNKDQAFVGAMGDLGVHKADLIAWLIDDPIAEVSALVGTLHKEIPIDDNAIFLLKTSGGSIGTLTASWTYYPNEVNSTILYCERGTMKIGADPVYGIVVEYADGVKEHIEIGKIQTNSEGGQTNSGVIDHFVEGILSGEGHEINGLEGLRALEVILAGVEAAKSGQIRKVSH
ncbi:Gfo/Idh/MocA family protein [Paenibacillus septentrionalis]|uniref:Gfo/Idh/MocA family protein n=1 Tax=Paenibacillus septentrionalis TaxID=429342 RepID=A0ABW1V6U8_9BACL